MKQREGYIFIDHRASPGLPEDLARALNLPPQYVGSGKMFESATLTCCHCRNVIIKNPLRQRSRYDCPKCGGKYLCDGCAAEARMPDYSHLPFEKKVDVAQGSKHAPLGSPFHLLQPSEQIKE